MAKLYPFNQLPPPLYSSPGFNNYQLTVSLVFLPSEIALPRPFRRIVVVVTNFESLPLPLDNKSCYSKKLVFWSFLTHTIGTLLYCLRWVVVAGKQVGIREGKQKGRQRPKTSGDRKGKQRWEGRKTEMGWGTEVGGQVGGQEGKGELQRQKWKSKILRQGEV